jgi:hypothetical protein
MAKNIRIGKTHLEKSISSGVDNWYLNEFFEEFICGR